MRNYWEAVSLIFFFIAFMLWSYYGIKVHGLKKDIRDLAYLLEKEREITASLKEKRDYYEKKASKQEKQIEDLERNLRWARGIFNEDDE